MTYEAWISDLEQPLTVSQVLRMSRQDMKVERCPP